MIQDGNPSEQKEVRATIDPAQVAQIYRELKKADEAPAQRKSFFKEKINSILQDKSVDEQNLNVIADLIEKHGEDLKADLASGAGQNNVQSMQARYAEAVADALEKYTDGDDELASDAEYLQSKIGKKLGSDPSVMQKFNTGVLDKQSIKAVTKAIVEEHSKKTLKRDKSAKGITMQNNAAGGASGKPIETSHAIGNIEGLVDQPRKESYRKLNSLLKRSGKYTPQEAHDKAYAQASRQFTKSGSQA